MAIIDALSRTKHLSELNSNLQTAEGNLTPLVRKQRVMASIFQGHGSAGTPGTGVVATETVSFNGDRTTQLVCTNVALGNGGDATNLAIGALIYTFPAGDYLFIDGQIKGTFGTAVLYTNVLDAGLGSVIGSGAVAILGGTATFEDYIGSLTTAALPTATVIGTSGDAAANGIRNRIVLAAAAHTLHVNAAGAWTDIAAAGAVTFTGNVVLRWRPLT